MIQISPEIPKELTDLGVVVGLVNPDGTLNEAWFGNPVGELRGVVEDDGRRDVLLDWATDLFGSVDVDLDLPGIDDGATWIPVAAFSSGETEGGLHLIVDASGAAVRIDAGAQVSVERDGVDASATVRVPLVAVDDGVSMAMGTDDGPVEFAATVLVDGLGVPGIVELGGLCVSATLPTTGSQDVDLTVVAKDLLLPGGIAADVALGDLADDLGELGPLAVQMLVGLISGLAESAPQAVRDLVALIGFDPDLDIPPLPIVDIVEQGYPALRAWLVEIVEGSLSTWLDRVGAFFTGDQAFKHRGAGTVTDPFAVCVGSPDGNLEACLTLVVENDATSGSIALTPGATLRFVADDTLPAVLVASMSFARLLLDHGLSVSAGPAVSAAAEVGPPVPGGNLIDTSVDAFNVRIGSVAGGFTLPAGGGVEPVIEARSVDIDGTTYDVIDLTDADAVAEAAAGGLEDLVLDALGIDGNPAAKALAVLAGLAEPDVLPDPTVPWPRVSVPSLFVDPIGAIGCYHVEVLSVDGRYQTIVEQIGILLGVDPTAVTGAVAGTGTENDPWTLTLFDNTGSQDAVRGTVDIVVWAGGGLPSVHVGMRSRPVFDLDGAAAGLQFRSDLLDINLPIVAACPAPVDLVWASRHVAILTIDDPSFGLDPVTIAADRLEVGLRLDRSNGIEPHMTVTNAAITVDGVANPLGDLDLGELSDFDDLPWPDLASLIGDWLDGLGFPLATELAELLGWKPGDPLPFDLSQFPDLTIGAPSLPTIDLSGLLADPVGTLIGWLVGLFDSDGAGTDLVLPEFLVAIGRFADLLADGHPGLTLDGTGTYADPWAICLAGTPMELLLWLDPEGPKLAGVVGIVEHLLPSDVLDGADHEAALALLDRAVAIVPDIADIAADRVGPAQSLIDGLIALRPLLEGDGLVPAVAQRVAGWSEHTMSPTAHLLEPAAFVMPQAVVDDVAEAGWIFVSSAALPTAPWPDQDQATVVDLTQPGIRPESIDLSHVTAGTRWHVLLPTRADAVVDTEPEVSGIDRLAQRLRRAVDHIHGIVGDDLALIAHSTAGHVARIVGADPVADTHVTHAVTVGTPHGGATFDVLDRPETANPLRTLARFRRLIDETVDTTDIDAVARLLDTLEHALDPYVSQVTVDDPAGSPVFVGFPAADFTVPAAYPDLDVGTQGHAVVGSVVAADLDAAIVAFVRRVLEAGMATLPTGDAVTHLGIGLRSRVLSPAVTSGSLTMALRTRVDLHRVRLNDGVSARTVPLISADVQLWRDGGWLVGGPDPARPVGAPRDPRARWVEARMRVDPTALADGELSIVVHDASVFGVHRDRWVVDLGELDGGTTLLPEIRVLLGEVAFNLGVLVDGSPVEMLASLLEAIGLGELVDGRLALLTDAFERFIIDPVGEVRLRLADRRDDIRSALGRLVPIEFGETSHRLDLGDIFDLRFDLDDAGLIACASVEISDLPVADIAVASGDITGCIDGSVVASLRVASAGAPGPLGRTVVEVDAAHGLADDPAGSVDVRLVTEFEGDLPVLFERPLILFPSPDVAEVAGHGLRVLLGEFTRRAFEFLRSGLDTVRGDALWDVLDGMGLVAADDDGSGPVGRLVNPAPLLAAAGRFLAAPRSLGLPPVPDVRYVPCLSGPDMSDLVDAVAALLGVATVGGGVPLPFGVTARVVVPVGGEEVQMVVGWDTPVTLGSTTVDGAVTLAVDCGLDVRAGIAATVETSGVGLDLARLSISADHHSDEATTTDIALRIRPSGGTDIDLTLWPTLSGLDGVDPAAAADAVLPLVLDAVAGDATIGQAAAALGDGLALRTAGRFDAAALRALAADPVGHLSVGNVKSALAQLETLLATWDLTSVQLAADTLTVDLGSGVGFSLSGPATLCLTLDSYAPVSGVEIDAEICLAAEDPRLRVRVEAEVVDPDMLEAGGVALMPRVAFYSGGTAPSPPDPTDRFEGGLWIDPPDAASRRGILAKAPFDGGAVSIVCREGTTDSDDLGACLDAAVENWAVPLALELALASPAVEDFLATRIAQNTTSIGEILTNAGVLDGGHLDADLLTVLVDRLACVAGAVFEAYAPLAALTVDPVVIGFDAADGEFGLTLSLSDDVDLASGSDVRLRLSSGDPDVTPVVVHLFSLDDDCVPSFGPSIVVSDIGLRVDNPNGGPLVDLVSSLDAIEVYGRLALGTDTDGGGVDFVFENLTLPFGIAEGTNPVAAKVLSSEQEDGAVGDAEELAPALSPRIELTTWPNVEVGFRLDVGDPPWWLPIQRAFGPIYVEQVGADTVEAGGELESLVFLLDGEVSLAGLTVGVDDLSLIIPVDSAANLTTWGIDLKALGVGYSGSGVELAGGFAKSTDPLEYIGMASLDIMGYGLSAIGAYGEFTDAAQPDSTYTSMFVFAALSAPLGGPPFFFVTAIGAGLGLNRELVLPEDVADIPGFPLVAAMDGGSDFASDPMGALENIGSSFPGRRGTFWVAAGVKFTSFVLLETVAVVAVEIGDGVEVALIGVSHAHLPDPSAPIAYIELALIARFSTAEGVLWVQAQLTDNSWLLSEDCRLTGGFAFVTWFNRGEFVFTVGGYHPRFDVPDYYPTVPRVGFNWTVDNALVIKGETYFALTSSAVMAGAALEASYTTSTVWASLSAGVDALVEWDPFFYDISAYVRVSAGIDVKICLLLCARVRMSFSMGASIRIWGPKLQGAATLELGPIDVTVTFGSGAKSETVAISWEEFVERFLVQGNPAGEAMSFAVTRGQLTPDTGDQSETDDGTLARPWRVVPEFTLRAETRAASTHVEAVGETSTTQTGMAATIDVAPTGDASVTSTFVVKIRDAAGNEVDGVEVGDFLISKLPDAAWNSVSREDRTPAADYIEAFSGVTLLATVTVAEDDIEVSLDLIDPSQVLHPLPFYEEIRNRVDEVIQQLFSDGLDFLGEADEVDDVYAAIDSGLADYSRSAMTTLSSDRVSPPRIAPLTEGMVDAIRLAVPTTPVPPPPTPVDIDRTTRPPLVLGLLRTPLASVARAPEPTSVGAAAEVPRVAAPRLADVGTPGGAFGRGGLRIASSGLRRRRGTVVPRSHAATTRTASRGIEAVRDFRADRATTAAIRAMNRNLIRNGQTVAPGDVVVLTMPNARHDEQAARPTLEVAGDQVVRLIGLDRAGVPSWERVVGEGSVDIPAATARIALIGRGAADGDTQGLGMSGWHAQNVVQKIASHTYATPGAVLRAASPRTRRSGSAVTLANVTAADAVVGRTAITYLPPATRTVVVGLSAIGTVGDMADAFASLTLGIHGAERTRTSDGDLVPPTIVITGDQVYGVFAVTPWPRRRRTRWLRVTTESDDRWNVVAVGGSVGSIDHMVEDLKVTDPAALFSAPADPSGGSTIRFVPAQQPDDVPPPDLPGEPPRPMRSR